MKKLLSLFLSVVLAMPLCAQKLTPAENKAVQATAKNVAKFAGIEPVKKILAGIAGQTITPDNVEYAVEEIVQQAIDANDLYEDDLQIEQDPAQKQANFKKIAALVTAAVLVAGIAFVTTAFGLILVAAGIKKSKESQRQPAKTPEEKTPEELLANFKDFSAQQLIAANKTGELGYMISVINEDNEKHTNLLYIAFTTIDNSPIAPEAKARVLTKIKNAYMQQNDTDTDLQEWMQQEIKYLQSAPGS